MGCSTLFHRLKQALHSKFGTQYSILHWKSIAHRPQNYSYVLLKECDAELGVITSMAAYENNRFWYFDGNPASSPVPENRILGWDYLPYDTHFKGEDYPLQAAFSTLQTAIHKPSDEIRNF